MTEWLARRDRKRHGDLYYLRCGRSDCQGDVGILVLEEDRNRAEAALDNVEMIRLLSELTLEEGAAWMSLGRGGRAWQAYGPVSSVPGPDGVYRLGARARRHRAEGRAWHWEMFPLPPDDDFGRPPAVPMSAVTPEKQRAIDVDGAKLSRLPVEFPYRAECPHCHEICAVTATCVDGLALDVLPSRHSASDRHQDDR